MGRQEARLGRVQRLCRRPSMGQKQAILRSEICGPARPLRWCVADHLRAAQIQYLDTSTCSSPAHERCPVMFDDGKFRLSIFLVDFQTANLLHYHDYLTKPYHLRQPSRSAYMYESCPSCPLVPLHVSLSSAFCAAKKADSTVVAREVQAFFCMRLPA
jgi:hypothetical protein